MVLFEYDEPIEEFMRNWHLLIFSISLLLLTACSSSRILDYPYGKVSKVVKGRFHQNEWTEKATRVSTIEEIAGRKLIIRYSEWEFPDIKIKSRIEIQPRKGNRTKVWVYIRDCNSWWTPTPLAIHWTWAKGVIDCLDERLGGWSWKTMPWGGAERLK